MFGFVCAWVPMFVCSCVCACAQFERPRSRGRGQDIISTDDFDEEGKSNGKESSSGAFDDTSSEASIGTVPAIALSSLIAALIFHI